MQHETGYHAEDEVLLAFVAQLFPKPFKQSRKYLAMMNVEG